MSLPLRTVDLTSLQTHTANPPEVTSFIANCYKVHSRCGSAAPYQYLLPAEPGKVSFMKNVEPNAMTEAASRTISIVLYASTG